MTDVIVNTVHRAPALRLKKPAAPVAGPATLAKPSGNVAVGALSRAVKGANAFVLSLRDGLTEQEREHRRKVEERRHILCLRMQNVRRLFPSLARCQFWSPC